jgi:hypothetical protein
VVRHAAAAVGRLAPVTIAPRLRLAVGAALIAALALAAVLLFTGGADGGTGTLKWAGETRVLKSGKPTDRIFMARLENASLRDVSLDVDDVRILDADGDEVQSTVRFLDAFVHGLFAWSQSPSKLTEFERRRLGQIVTIKPGKTAPVTLSWRVPAGGSQPERVEFGPTSIDLP